MPALKEAQPPRFLVIHHTDIAERSEQAQLVNESHQRRGYHESSRGWFIAYHYLIGKDGTVLQTRDHDERTQHTSCGLGLNKCRNVKDINEHSLAIVLAGNFEHEQPTLRQLEALRKLVKELDTQYSFQQIMTHRDASPTACPGDNLVNAIQDVLRKPDNIWHITRYYTPEKGQERYYRTVSDKNFIHTSLDTGLVTFSDAQYWFSFSGDWIGIGQTLEEADQWFNDRPEQKEAIRKELEYMADFKVNCHGNCLSPADGGPLYTNEDAFKVAACPPKMPFGTKIDIEGIGTVTCRDRGGSIVGKRIDLWAGQGKYALDMMKQMPGGPLPVTINP